VFTVLSRPYDDKEIVEVYIADHDTKSKEKFESEWFSEREKIQKKDPEYSVTDIIKALEHKGWQIMHVLPAKVTY
jgi:hypothetical protein